MKKGALGFALFVLLNAALFIRPAEIISDLQDARIYEALIICCLAVSLPGVARQFSAASLATQPITVCVLGVLVATVLSHMARVSFGEALQSGTEFGKIVLYYLLLIAVVDSPARLRRLLEWLAVFIVVLTVLALLQYHEVIDISSLVSASQRQDEINPETGEAIVLVRLCSTGIFHNPNDLARILALGMVGCLYLLNEGASRWRALSLPVIGLFGYALALTHSRGGFLALLGGLGTLLIVRFGRWKTALLGLIGLPLLLLVFQGRQTNITLTEGTAGERIRLWSEGFQAFRQSPIFGIGMNQYEEMAGGRVAHNSFMQCYTELGLVGGFCFTGAFVLALVLCWRLAPGRVPNLDAALTRLRPYLLALLVTWVVGMFSSTRSYSVPTYLLLALGAAYARLASGYLPSPIIRFNGRLVGRLAAVSTGVLVMMYVYVRVVLQE